MSETVGESFLVLKFKISGNLLFAIKVVTNMYLMYRNDVCW